MITRLHVLPDPMNFKALRLIAAITLINWSAGYLHALWEDWAHMSRILQANWITYNPSSTLALALYGSRICMLSWLARQRQRPARSPRAVPYFLFKKIDQRFLICSIEIINY